MCYKAPFGALAPLAPPLGELLSTAKLRGLLSECCRMLRGAS